MIRTFGAALLIAACGSIATASTELLTNGGFETGDFTGWTASTFPASNGTVVVTSGSTAPVSGFAVSGPSEGTYQTLTGQSGPGAYSVMQSFTVPVDAKYLLLDFDMFSVTDAGLTDNGLDPFCCGPTQLSRVDILTAGAGAFDLGASVVHNVLAPFVDGPFPGAYSSYSFDIRPFLVPGMTYQLRFAQSDNQGFMTMGVDGVSLVAAVPLPAAGLLLVGGLGLIGGVRAARKG